MWIDYFNGRVTRQTETLDGLLSTDLLVIGDLILVEVLQGFATERDFNRAKGLLKSLTLIEIGGHEIAIQAAENYRRLRESGITVRKTIDTLIATRCIESGLNLLHNDRDFDAFVRYLGLQSVE